MSDPSAQRVRPIRAAIESVPSALLMGGKVAAWSYRRGWHGKPGVVHYAMPLGGQQRLAAPLRIAVVSNLHAGPTTHGALTRGSARVAPREQFSP